MTGAVAPDAAALLAAWEAGAAWPPVARGAAVLDVLAAPDAGSALDLPLPQLAALAVRCRAALFGPDVDGTLECPGCGELLEVSLRLDGLFGDPGPAMAEVAGAAGVVVRAPTARDLVAAAGGGVSALLERCAGGAGGLTAEALAEVDAALERVTGGALPVLRTRCPECDSEVSAVVDPAGILAREVAAAAPEVLADVARLAAAFGWAERDVLALGAVRRAAYLALVP